MFIGVYTHIVYAYEKQEKGKKRHVPRVHSDDALVSSPVCNPRWAGELSAVGSSIKQANKQATLSEVLRKPTGTFRIT